MPGAPQNVALSGTSITWAAPTEVPKVERFARENAERVTVVGISDSFSTDVLDDFLTTHSITFTTLVDTPELQVTSHYGIGFGPQFRMLDPYSHTGDKPLFFDHETPGQVLADVTGGEPAARMWDLEYLTGG